MAQPYIGEIRMFAGTFAPVGWSFCDGSLLQISEYDTLFNLIGTTYGGDGQSTFGLPDLRGRVPVHQGPGFIIGQEAGAETVTLTTQQIASHTHPLAATTAIATASGPGNNVLAQSSVAKMYFADVVDTPMANAIGMAGGTQPHDNMQPFLCISFIISLYGIYPSPT
jgi:microcystin-dependent protein